MHTYMHVYRDDASIKLNLTSVGKRKLRSHIYEIFKFRRELLVDSYLFKSSSSDHADKLEERRRY